MPKIIYSPEHLKFVPPAVYDPHLHELAPHPDRPELVDVVLQALADLSWPVIRESGDYNLESYFGVHSGDLISFYREVDSGLSSGFLESPLVPGAFAVRRLDRQPKSLDGRLGWFCTDVRTPICTGTWAAACGSLSATIAGADLVLSGERVVYVLARPAGHHAGRDFFGGGSYLNNAAGAVMQLSKRSRTAVIEMSYHHGSGTQDIFSGFREVPFASVHVDPDIAYPYFSGYADQKGDGKGRGSIRNYPVGLPLEEKRFLAALRNAISDVKRTRPGTLIVSLGADLSSQPVAGSAAGMLQGLSLPTTVYSEAGRMIGALKLPTLVIQEEIGNPEVAGEAVLRFLQAFSDT
jgi:acetoin utilization deacetylase AcuC-like enzyme